MNTLLTAHLAIGILVLLTALVFIWNARARAAVGAVLGLQIVVGAFVLREVAVPSGHITPAIWGHVLLGLAAMPAYIAVRFASSRSRNRVLISVAGVVAIAVVATALFTGRALVVGRL